MLQEAIEAEVSDYLARHAQAQDPGGRRGGVRNGHLPGREILSGIGPIRVEQPRVRDRREGMKFTSAILPPYLRRTPNLEALSPTLYLKGVSTNDFPEALGAILGEGAKGLSAGTIVRLKEAWETEYQAWQKRDLSLKRYVYFWADGVYFNVRLGARSARRGAGENEGRVHSFGTLGHLGRLLRKWPIRLKLPGRGGRVWSRKWTCVLRNRAGAGAAARQCGKGML